MFMWLLENSQDAGLTFWELRHRLWEWMGRNMTTKKFMVHGLCIAGCICAIFNDDFRKYEDFAREALAVCGLPDFVDLLGLLFPAVLR